MYTLYFDTGTTNTRAYLLRDLDLVGGAQRAVGVRDCARAGTSAPLIAAVRGLHDELLGTHGLTAADIAHMCMSGMATSPDGLREVPHLDAPVTLDALRAALVPHRDPELLPGTVWLVPGVRALPDSPGRLTPEQAVDVHIMRGEETEILGVLDGQAEGRWVVALPGSHTQTAVVEDGAIVDLCSSITGELRSALLDRTILGSALRGDPPQTLDPRFVELGHRTLVRTGLNHALYAVRTLALFGDATEAQRHAYFQGVLTAGAVEGALRHLIREDGPAPTLLVAGRRSEYDAYATIAGLVAPRVEVRHRESGDVPFSVRGYRRIAQDNPLLAG